MKILVVCDQGINRSVTLASQLKYLGHDTLSAGLATNSTETLMMLINWADLIILTDRDQMLPWSDDVDYPPMERVQLWNIGEDRYPRPYNKDLLKICKRLIAEHPEIRNG